MSCSVETANWDADSATAAGKSTDPAFYQTVPRRVGAMAKTYAAGYAGFFHSHARAQLLYAESGVMKVTTEEGFWVVPPQRAVWLPAGYMHRTAAMTLVEMRTLYIQREACPRHFPRDARVINVSPLMRELVLRATAMPVEYDENGRDGKIIDLIFEEIEWSGMRRLQVPVVQDARLIRIEDAMLRDPADARTLEDWAASEGLSCRTLTRLVQRDLGMTFRHWRHSIRVGAAIQRLAAGDSVTQVAIEVGYETPSAFAAMFRRSLGVLPSQYYAQK
jgi:AraC-like DNA-binding protein/mannose-6-phosphate isomerase-like protein (cupin superfamily)